MTPLALRVFRDLLLPAAKRTVIDQGRVFDRLADVHCFEVSEVSSLATDLATRSMADGFDWTRTFLPFPRTWLEFAGPPGSGERNAFLLCADRQDVFWHITQFGGAIETSAWEFVRPSSDEDYIQKKEAKRSKVPGAAAYSTEEKLLATLSIINTPRILRSEDVPPHQGLVRDLHRAGYGAQKLPVHASTTIRLDLTPFGADGTTAPGEGRLTGPRALHWCRAHLRLQRGKIVLVKAHQRGSDEVGTRDADYRLKAPTG